MLADQQIPNDFFNNVAAVAAVLLFTKVVSHAIHKNREHPVGHWLLALHVLNVLGVVVAVGVSLLATFSPDQESVSARHLHQFAWGGLVLSGITLIAALITLEYRDWQRQHKDNR